MGWLKHHAVVSIAFLAAMVSAILVPPDEAYRGYFETRTLMCLFAMMAVIAALDNVTFFEAIGNRVVRHLRSRRAVILGLVLTTGFGAMLISNDMALLTFLPLTFVVLRDTHNLQYLAFAFVMEAAAANLGGMITPFGSPQNLFLYSEFEIPASEFFSVLLLPFTISMLTIAGICLTVKNKISEPVEIDNPFVLWPTAAYLVLFVLSILMVFRVLPVTTGFLIVLVILILDPKAILKVDWGLMLTFVFFFVFAGNLARIEAVHEALTILLHGDVMLWSILTSQIISNVPAAILIAQFTTEYRQILVGVNVGGVGTIVASLASVIALVKYRTYQPGHTGRFLAFFFIVNSGLLIVLVALMKSVSATGWL